MVLKYFYTIVLSFLALLTFAQSNLFFTDAYSTNLYKNTENTITFNNNLIAVLNDDAVYKVDSVFQVYFNEVNIKVEKDFLKKDFQITYRYTNNNQDFLTWSRVWFHNYEMKLLSILNEESVLYLQKNIDNYATIYEAVQNKIILNAYYNYNDRVNDITNTQINISSNNVNVNSFLKNNIKPNNSLKRTITSGKNNFFNEAFNFNQALNYKYFIISTNSKSRLIDCFSAHLFCNILNIDAPTYLNNISYLKFNQIDTSLITKENIVSNIDKSKIEFLNIINNPLNSFYNLNDIEDLTHTLNNYSIKDLKKFIELYLIKNSINEVVSNEDTTIAYNHSLMNDSVHFKVNSYKIKSKEDSLKLEAIATFLIKNPLKEIQILGLANNNEYLKVDKMKYLKLIEIYKEYDLIKVSKRINLPLYRSLIVFEYLYKKGVAPESMICISKKVKNTEENKAFVYFNYKL